MRIELFLELIGSADIAALQEGNTEGDSILSFQGAGTRSLTTRPVNTLGGARLGMRLRMEYSSSDCSIVVDFKKAGNS